MSVKDTIISYQNAMIGAAYSDPHDKQRELFLQKTGLSNDDLNAFRQAHELETTNEPDDIELATLTKNNIFSKAAGSLPIADIQGVTGLERFTLKNLFDTASNELQQKYLADKGYETKYDSEELLVRRPDQMQWQRLDPKKIDMMEVVKDTGDILVDILQGSLSTGTTLTGAIGIGAGMGALTEGVKRAARNLMGYDESAKDTGAGMALQTGIGALGGGLGYGLGKVISKGLASSMGDPVLKTEAPAIKKAASRLGIDELLPEQTIDSRKIKGISEALQKSGVGPTAKIARQLYEQLTSAADSAIAKAFQGRRPGEVSQDSIKIIFDEMSAPARAIYDQIETPLKWNRVPKDMLEQLLKSIPKTPNTQEPRAFLESWVGKIKNLSHLKEVRTMVAGELPADITGVAANKIQAYRQIRDGLTNIRSTVLKNNSATNIKSKIETADALYRVASQESDRLGDVMSIIKKSLTPDKTEISYKQLAKNISPINLPPSEGLKLFGKELYSKLIDIKTLADSIPGVKENPSGSATVFNALKNVIFPFFSNLTKEAAVSIARSMTNPGKITQFAVPRGLGILGVQSAKQSPIIDKGVK